MEVVTKLTVDSAGAQLDLSRFAEAMTKAEVASAKAVASMTTGPNSVQGASNAWTKALASTDPVFAAQVRRMAEVEKAYKTANAAVAAGIIDHTAAAAQVQRTADKYDAMTVAARKAATGQATFGDAIKGVQGQIIALQAGAGVVGTFLAAIPGWGLAAAIGLGAVTAAINHMIDESNRLGDKAVEMKKFMELTGLTALQVKALTDAGKILGVDAGEITTSIERFTVGLEEARKGTGALFDKVREINPELARQLAQSTSTAQGIDVYARALKNAGSEAQRAALSRAGLGKGGQESGLALIRVDDTGGLDAAAKKTEKLTGLTDELVRETARLRNENIQLEKETANLYAGIYTGTVLKGLNEELRIRRDIALEVAKAAKTLTPSENTAYYAGAAGDPLIAAAINAKNPGNEAQIGSTKELKDAVKELDEIFTKFVGTISLYTDGADRAAARAKATADSLEVQLKASQRLANTERDRISVLGSAATFEEKRLQKINEINVALGENKIKQEDANRAIAANNLDAQIQKTSALSSILGVSATVTQQVNARREQLNQTNARGAGATQKQIDSALELTRLQALGISQINSQIDSQRVEAATIGMTSGAAAAYRAEQEKLNEALRNNQALSPTERAELQAKAKALGDVTEATDKARIANELAFQRKTALLSSQDVAIAQQLKSLYPDVTTALESTEAAQIRVTNALKEARNAAESFATGIADGLLSGKSLADSLSASLNNLAKTAANAGIKNLLEGNFAMAAVDAVVTIGAKLAAGFFDNSQEKELKKAKETWAGMTDQMNTFIRAADGFDLSKFASAIYQVKTTADQLWIAATNAGDKAGADRVAMAFVHSIWNQMDQFARSEGPKKGEFAQAIEDQSRAAAQLIQSMKDVNFYSEEAGNTIRNNLATQISYLRNQASQSLQSEINEAQGKGFINDLNNLFQTVSQLRSDASITGVDTGLIDKFLQVQAQKIVDGAGLVGDSFTALINQFPNLTGLVHESTDAIKAQADAQTALQDSLNQSAKSIVDYVSDLRAGAGTNLSPSARLSAAQGSYNATLALAQGNNVDALHRITSDFENLRKAAQDFYGSSAGYQNILSSGINQLLSLPAVQTSTDPVVQALLDVQAKITQTTTAVGGATTAIGGTTTAVGGTTTAVGANTQSTAQLLNTTIIRLDTSISKLAETVMAMNSNVGLLITIRDLTSSINGLQNTATQQLQVMNAANQVGSITVGPGNVIALNNNMLTALNKIVYNTGATARNTQFGTVNGSWIANASSYPPTFAEGGWITGGIPNRDSVRLASGALGMPDEFVVRKSIAQANKSWLPTFNETGRLPQTAIGARSFAPAANDNSLIAKVEALTAEVRFLRAENRDDANGNRSELRNVNRNIRDNTENRVDTATLSGRDARLAARRKAA